MYLSVPPILRLFFLLFSPYEIPQISAFFDFYFFLKILLTNLYPSYIITLALRKTRKKQRRKKPSGCGSAWLERLVWDQEVAGSNPVTPT